MLPKSGKLAIFLNGRLLTFAATTPRDLGPNLRYDLGAVVVFWAYEVKVRALRSRAAKTRQKSLNCSTFWRWIARWWLQSPSELALEGAEEG
jgi:hypothetical protein